jgi:DNA ligase 1
MKQLPIIYSRTSHGSVQQWQIIVEDNKFYTVEGLVDGKLTTTPPTVCEGKNQGKANETSGAEQAAKEAKSKWQKKVDSGYYEDIAQIDVKKFTEPMLAKKYEDEIDSVVYPVYCQPKLDGIRCVTEFRITKDGMTSRNGKPIVSAPHVVAELAPLFVINPKAELDGELYCDKFSNDFNKIVSLVKKTKPTAQDLAESAASIQYHVYDYISEGKLPFSERHSKLVLDLIEAGLKDSAVIKVVATYKCDNKEQLDKYYGEFLEAGYEGQMVRLDKPYEHKRSKSLLKRKEFIDAEFEVLDVVEGVGNRAGTVGYMVVKMPDGRHFKTNVKGTFALLAEYLKDKKNIIGKQVTIKFFCYTPDGIPRFPYVISIRDYE